MFDDEMNCNCDLSFQRADRVNLQGIHADLNDPNFGKSDSTSRRA